MSMGIDSSLSSWPVTGAEPPSHSDEVLEPVPGAPVARRLDENEDPHIASLTPSTPATQEHAGTGTLVADPSFGGVLSHGYNCHSFAFHAGAGHPGGAQPDSPDWDISPLEDMRAAHRITDTERVRVGDVLVYGDDHNGNGRVDQTDEALHSVVVIEVDAQGRAVRVAGKLGSDVVSDHHPSQLDPQLRPLNGMLHEWYRPAETPRQLAQRLNFVQSKLQTDVPPADRKPLDWLQDPRLAPLQAGTKPPQELPGLAPTESGAAHNPHAFAWNRSGGASAAASNPDDLYGVTPVERQIQAAQRLGPKEPVRVGDVLVYGTDRNRNDRLEIPEIATSAAVTEVDAQGRILRVRAQTGPYEAVVDQHPRHGGSEDPLQRTAVFRPR